ncbi:three-helix bundle dimerization domain-containing protein [Nocardia farcinica]|uniref:three-helix bundle dimerization domain-containing protein n=1 Tax=Nocardia farcinica TaxID=37329 RepID=UPI0037882400
MAVDTVREEQALRRLADSLVESYTETHPPERVRTVIDHARARFTGNPVREFVPILVERIARRELDRTAGAGPVTSPAPATSPAPDAGAAAQPSTRLESAGREHDTPHNRTGHRAPAISADAESRGSGARHAATVGRVSRRTLALAGGALLVVAVVVAAQLGRQPEPEPAAASGPALTVVRGAVGSEKASFFEDQRVIDALARHGLRAEIEPAGSRQIADMDLSGYSFAFPSSATAAERIQRARGVATKYTPFSSPMAIATFAPLADLLTGAGVLRPGPVPTVDMARYLELVQRNTEWTHLPGNTVYPVRKNILVSTTDPRTSNSAAMFLAIAAFVANDNAVVQGSDAEQRVLPQLTRLFTGQGYAENSSAGPFQEYLTAGMGPAPLVLIYEAQYVEALAQGRIQPGMVLAYPSPTVLSTHTVVPFDEPGDRLGRLLTTDPELQRLAAEHGFRTRDAAQFAAVAAEHRAPVPAELIDVVDTPTYDTLESLLDGVTRSYN